MDEVIRRFTSSVNAPLVIDSTETPVIESALKLHGGKPIINSINFEDGEAAAESRLHLARRFGAAVIALTIDEQGMAKSPERKLEIAERLVAFACGRHGLPQSDLLIDPLTFTIATGNEDDRKLAQWTLEGIAAIRARFPDVQIILGLSNVSFGLNPAARAVLNSVFLDHAVRAGMTGAIVHVSKIRPLHQLAADEVAVAEDLIFDRRREDYDPLARILEMFADRKAADATTRKRAETVEERLRERIVDGDRKGLTDDLDAAMQRHRAARHHQHHPARRHEGGGRAVRRRQDAASVRAAKCGDDEGGGRLARAAHGARGGAGEGHDRARDREGRRARHRQEPG